MLVIWIGAGLIGGPNGNRTRVSGVRGQRPRPLDDGTVLMRRNVIRNQSAVISKKKMLLGVFLF